MRLNYRRDKPPITAGVHVDLIVRPLKLTHHTEAVISSQYYGDLPFCCGVKFHKDRHRVTFLHRLTSIQFLLEESFGV